MENTNQNNENRTKSPRKKSEMIRCPACNALVKSTEIKRHCDLEIDRLIKFQLNGRSCNDRSGGNSENGQHGSTSTTNSEESCPWVTYQKVRNNRHSRLKTKSRKRVANPEPICPVCNERPTEDINLHVEKCLRLKSNQSDGNGSRSGDDNDEDDDSIDIEGETYDEYEWAGQKRIRASSLLQGGYSALGVGSQITNIVKDEEEDLNVDGDDTQMYGPPQYTESDVILTIRDENTNDNGISTYLRNLICGQSTSQNVPTTVNESSSNNDTNMDVQPAQSSYCSSEEADVENDGKNTNSMIESGQNSTQIIESLKSKIRDYEKQMCNKLKCLICLDDFRNPAISVCCWHVHCEKCWLQTLGTRRLCPQCNLITSPSDLRRIYM